MALLKGLSLPAGLALNDDDEASLRNILQTLDYAARPLNCDGHWPGARAETEAKILSMLRKEAATCLNKLDLFRGARLQSNYRANGVAITFAAAQTKCDRVADGVEIVPEDTELRTSAVFQNEFQTAVAIEIGESKGATIVNEIEPEWTG